MTDKKVRSEDTSEHQVGAGTQVLAPGPDDELIGKLIDGKYRVEAQIGAGGMGKVYRGRNTRTDSPVAIKTLIPDLVADESLVKRFEIEAKSASNLRHPNTIRIYDFGKEGDILFMVMELLDGDSLEGLLRKSGALPPDRVINIVRQACRSLDEAHATGLVHRDIKPDNLFLNRVGDSEEDHVKVLDFGVAKLRDKQHGNATLTQAGMIFGTPRYMSPEQARAFELDGRSDIYALGVVMFECLTGSPPFLAPDPVSVLIKHVNEPIPTFAEINPQIEPMPELEEVVRRCMAKKPEERFDNVKNLLNALDGVGQHYGMASTMSATIHRQGPAHTLTLSEEGANDTPAGSLNSGAFDQFGVAQGDKGGKAAADPQLSKYTLGAARQDVPSGLHGAAADNKTVIRVVIGLVAAVLVVAAALLLLIRSPTQEVAEAAPAAPVAEPPAAPVEPESVAAATQHIAPIVEIATVRTREAGRAAATRAAARVVPMTLRVEPADAAAFARLEGSDDEPVPLPHTFHFTRDPASPPVTLKFEVTADGYRTTTQEAPLLRSEGPIVVSLRRVSSSRPAGTSVAVPPPPSRTGPLRDPYGR